MEIAAFKPRELAIEIAVREGDLERMHLWMTRSFVPRKEAVIPTILGLALEYKRLEVLQWALVTQRTLAANNTRSCCLGLPKGTRALKHWTSDVDQEHTRIVRAFERMSDAMDDAALCGYLEALQWAHANQTDRCSSAAIVHALTNGHVDVANWLQENYPAGYFEHPIGCCLSLDMADWFANLYQWKDQVARDAWIDDCIDHAAYHNQLDVLDCLVETRKSIHSPRPLNVAAARGHFTMVRRLNRARAKATTAAMDDAAANGHLAIVRWLHKHRREGCTTKAMDRAAAGNHLRVVQWLHKHHTGGCTQDAIDEAAGNGHLEMVQWLHAHTKFKYCTAKGIEKVRRMGHFDVLTWLYLNTKSVDTTTLLQARCSIWRQAIHRWVEDKLVASVFGVYDSN